MSIVASLSLSLSLSGVGASVEKSDRLGVFRCMQSILTTKSPMLMLLYMIPFDPYSISTLNNVLREAPASCIPNYLRDHST